MSTSVTRAPQSCSLALKFHTCYEQAALLPWRLSLNVLRVCLSLESVLLSFFFLPFLFFFVRSFAMIVLCVQSFYGLCALASGLRTEE